MTSLQTSPSNSNRTLHKIKLNRIKDEVSCLLNELNSYRFAPQTPKQYEDYQELTNLGKELKQTIKKLVQPAFNSEKHMNTDSNDLNSIFNTYHLFQQNLSNYSSSVI